MGGVGLGDQGRVGFILKLEHVCVRVASCCPESQQTLSLLQLQSKSYKKAGKSYQTWVLIQSFHLTQGTTLRINLNIYAI